MALSKDTIRRLIQALALRESGNQVLGSLGQYGGFSVNSDASVAVVSGDIAVIPSPGNLGAYRVLFPNINSQIQSIDWFEVSGFTPRNPNGAETCTAAVTGYNRDSSSGQWYITVQIASLADQSLQSSPPQGFVIGVRAAMTLAPQSNAL